MIKLTHDALFEIQIDSCGIFEIPSGTAGHMPGDASIVYRNVSMDRWPTDEEQATIKQAGLVSEAALQKAADRIFYPVGRARQSFAARQSRVFADFRGLE